MAIRGTAYSERITFKCGDGCKTTTSQYKAVYMYSSMTVCLCSNSADKIVGIIDSMQSAGSTMVTVIVHGVATGLMQSGTTAAIGDWLVVGTDGAFITALTNTTANQRTIGYLLDVPGSGGAATVFVSPQAIGTIV